jgi:hypothetical protein
LRTSRAAAVAGIIFAVLLITALVLLRISVPARPQAPGAWLADSGRRAAVAISLNLIPFAGIAFLWFIGVLRDRIGEREDRLFVGMLFVFTLTTVNIARRTAIVSRWLVLAGLACALTLLVGIGVSPWVELLFPAWILALSLEILLEIARDG